MEFIAIIILVWMFKNQLNQLVSSWTKTATKYSEAAEHHAARVSTFTKIDADFAEKEATIRAKARLKALKENEGELPDL